MIGNISDQLCIDAGVSFVFFTDIHFGHYQSSNSKYLIKKILDKTSVPFAVFGGDIPYAYGTEYDLNASIKEYKEYQELIGKERIFQTRGNHDLGITDNIQSRSYAKSFGFVNSIFAINNGWHHKSLSEHMCCALVNESEKIKILILNSYDKQSENAPWGCEAYLSKEQMEWVVNDVMSDEGYNYIVVSHLPSDSSISYYGASQEVLQDLLIAIKNKQSFSCTIDGTTISKDFTSTTNDIICHITGHAHKDESHVDNGVISITTTSDCALEDGGIPRSIGTLTEQAFDVFTFDMKNMKIYAYRVGAGENREWNI